MAGAKRKQRRPAPEGRKNGYSQAKGLESWGQKAHEMGPQHCRDWDAAPNGRGKQGAGEGGEEGNAEFGARANIYSSGGSDAMRGGAASGHCERCAGRRGAPRGETGSVEGVAGSRSGHAGERGPWARQEPQRAGTTGG